MSGQISLASHPEASNAPNTTPTANEDHIASDTVLVHCFNTKKALIQGHNPTKSLNVNVPQFEADKPSDSRRRARTISHAHPSHSPRDFSDNPLVPDDSPTIQLRAAGKRPAPSHPQLSPIVTLAESKTCGLWETPRDPAILYVGTKGPGMTTHDNSPVRTHRDEDGANAGHLDRNSIIEELLAKLKEFAPHIDEVSQRMGVDGGLNKSAGNVEELCQSWEDAKQNGLRYIDGSPVKEHGAQLTKAPTRKKVGRKKSGSLDSVEDPTSSFIKVSVLLADLKHPGKEIEWPIYLKVIPLSHDAFWVGVDFPYGFPFPQVSSDGTFRVKVKNREEFPIGVWPDDTLLLGIDEPGYRFPDVASSADIHHSSTSSVADEERNSQALLTATKLHIRAENFPFTHSFNGEAALQAKSGAPNHKYQRRQNHSCPAPPSSLSNHQLQIDTSRHHEKAPLLLASTVAPVSKIKYMDASTQINIPIDQWGIPSQIRHHNAKPQIEISIHPWKVLVPLPLRRGRLPGNSLPEPPTKVPDESRRVDGSLSTGDGVGFKNSQAYEKILSILNEGKKDRLEMSQRVSSDGIRALADTIWTSSEGKKFVSREEVLSELKKKPMSPETYRTTMQQYNSRNIPKIKCHEIGGSNWRKPAPLVNRRYRPDVRNVFPKVYEDCTATSGPIHNLAHNRQSNNNGNRRLPDHSGLGSAEEHDIFEHVQTLREKGDLERLWRLKEALEKSLSEEKENLMPIRQPLQPIPGEKGFKNKSSYKRTGFKRASDNQAPSRPSRNTCRSLNRTDDSDATVVRREQKSSGQFSCETLVEREHLEIYDNLGSWEEPPELPPAYTNSQDPIPFLPPVVYGGPLYVHDSLRYPRPSVPQDPILSRFEPVYFHNPHHSFMIQYPQIASIPFDEGTLSSHYQSPEPFAIPPPVVDGQSLPRPQMGFNVPFPAFQPIVSSATSHPRPGNFFTASIPQPATCLPIGNLYNPIQPPNHYPDISPSYTESGTHMLCHRLQKDKAAEILEKFKAEYPVTGKNLFKENIRHQNSLRKSKGKARGKDAAAIQQDLELKLLQKKEKMIREMARGRKNGDSISIRITKSDEGGNEDLED